MKNIIQSSLFTRTILFVGALLIILVVFLGGEAVGYRRAEFSSRWNMHYQDMFGGPNSPFAFRPDSDDIQAANGAAGQVIAINLPTIAVKGPNEAEKVILITSATVLRKFRDAATTTDIHVGDVLVAIGSPDEQGRIIATFARIMPPPGTASGTPSGAPMMNPRAY